MEEVSSPRKAPAVQMRDYIRFLGAYVGTLVSILVALMVWSRTSGADHVFAIPGRDGIPWYRDFGGRSVGEILDQTLYYDDIGASVEDAKASDIVILGPSFVSFAVDQDTLKRGIEAKYGLSVYNMAFIGVRGGEFSRRVVERWRIKPRLWLINVDDQFIHFFSRDFILQIGAVATPIEPVRHWRPWGFLYVARTELRWRLEDVWAGMQNQGADHALYRNPETGQMDLSADPRYDADGNPTLKVARSPDCHVTPETIEIGRAFLQSLGGKVVLFLVPHSQYCPTQARELAAALGVEVLIPPGTDYTMVDGGGHMDHKGAVEFTRYLADALARTRAFQDIVRERK